MSTPTVTQRFSQALAETAERTGLVSPAAMRSAGRVPLEVQDGFWEQLCAANNEPLLGIQLGLNLQVGHLDVAGLLLMSCETLGESLDTLLEYLPVIGEGGEAGLACSNGQAQLCYTPVYRVRRAERVEMVLSCILHLARWSTGGRFRAEALHFSHRPLDDPHRYAQLLGCAVQFDSERNQLVFEAGMLELPLIQANSTLRDQLRALADETLQQLGNRSLSASVSALLREQPQAGKDRIAELLAMSGRHLNRRLAEEGLSFKQLRDRELQALAGQALRRGDKITAIAHALGFSDESAFSKAFRRWTGVTPTQFREQSNHRSAR